MSFVYNKKVDFNNLFKQLGITKDRLENLDIGETFDVKTILIVNLEQIQYEFDVDVKALLVWADVTLTFKYHSADNIVLADLIKIVEEIEFIFNIKVNPEYVKITPIIDFNVVCYEITVLHKIR